MQGGNQTPTRNLGNNAIVYVYVTLFQILIVKLLNTKMRGYRLDSCASFLGNGPCFFLAASH